MLSGLLLLGLNLLAPPSAAASFDDVGGMPRDLWESVKEEGRPEGLWTLAGAGAAAGIATTGDGHLRDTLQRSTPLGARATSAGALIGSAGAVGLGTASYLAGVLLPADAARGFGLMSLEAMAVSGAEAEVLKFAVRRERPDFSDRYSFPSGHSAASFSAATVAARQFGWKVGVPAYAAAGFVGYTRMEKNKHYLSDVLFGAGLGIAAGRAVCKVHERAKVRRVTWAPFVMPDGAGVLFFF